MMGEAWGCFRYKRLRSFGLSNQRTNYMNEQTTEEYVLYGLNKRAGKK